MNTVTAQQSGKVLEKRKYQRFSLGLVTLLKPTSVQANDNKAFYLISRDISTSGIFLMGSCPVECGASVELEVHMPKKISGENHKDIFNLDTCGRVVRKTDEGFAIQFNKGCHIRH